MQPFSSSWKFLSTYEIINIQKNHKLRFFFFSLKKNLVDNFHRVYFPFSLSNYFYLYLTIIIGTIRNLLLDRDKDL